jgi:hypothetical protein
MSNSHLKCPTHVQLDTRVRQTRWIKIVETRSTITARRRTGAGDAGNSRLNLRLHIPVHSSLGGRSRSAVAQAVDEEVE